MTKPASAPESRIPSRVSGVDIRKLPIGPEEAFVWSRADGYTGPGEISLSTGLDETSVTEALAKLRRLGAIRYEGDDETPLAPSAAAATVAKGATPQVTRSSLEPAQEKRVSDMLRAVEHQDCYQLLGVQRNASKAIIKEAYFELIGNFHPDRYFGQELGENKAKLERVFAKLTQAHDTLTRHKLRAEYDAKLPPEAPSETARPTDTEAPGGADGNTLKSPVQTATNEPAQNPSQIKGSNGGAPSATPPRAGASAIGTSQPLDAETRRRVLARRLANPSDAAQSARGVASSGKLPAVNMRGLGPPPAIQRYLTSAAEAEAEGNLVGMANSLRLAIAVQPDDASLGERLKAVEARADVEFADGHLAQAKSQEANHDYASAARLYARAARGKRSSSLFKQAAECCLKGDEDLRQAGEHAKQAVNLDPENADLRLMLGKIYAQAGMRASALSELDKASQLSPGDDTIKGWLKRVKSGDL